MQITANHGDRPLRVLVVEDQALVAMVLEDILADMGCVVVGTAASAAQALAIVAGGGVDLALMDVDIDGPVDGVGAAAAILEARGVRSLFVTAHVDEAFRNRAAPTRPLGFVAKPYGQADISRAIAGARPSLPLAA